MSEVILSICCCQGVDWGQNRGSSLKKRSSAWKIGAAGPSIKVLHVEGLTCSVETLITFPMESEFQVPSHSKRRWIALLELLLAIASEQIGTSAMKASNGFTNMALTVLALVGYAMSMLWFGRSMRVLPMGFAYALWVGVGMVVASFLGIALFSEVLSIPVVIGLLFVFAGILVLNSSQQQAV